MDSGDLYWIVSLSGTRMIKITKHYFRARRNDKLLSFFCYAERISESNCQSIITFFCITGNELRTHTCFHVVE